MAGEVRVCGCALVMCMLMLCSPLLPPRQAELSVYRGLAHSASMEEVEDAITWLKKVLPDTRPKL